MIINVIMKLLKLLSFFMCIQKRNLREEAAADGVEICGRGG